MLGWETRRAHRRRADRRRRHAQRPRARCQRDDLLLSAMTELRLTRQRRRLSRLPVGQAGRPARRRGDGAVLHRAVRQSRFASRGGRRRDGDARGRARDGRGLHRRAARGDRLHLRRHRVEQPRASRLREPQPARGRPRRHLRSRPHLDPQHRQGAREGGLPGQQGAAGPVRAHRPGEAAQAHHRRDDPGLGRLGEQRDRHRAADGRDRRGRRGHGRGPALRRGRGAGPAPDRREPGRASGC